MLVLVVSFASFPIVRFRLESLGAKFCNTKFEPDKQLGDKGSLSYQMFAKCIEQRPRKDCVRAGTNQN